MAQACNPSTLGGLSERITGAQEFQTSLGNIGRPRLYKKFKKPGVMMWACSPSYLGSPDWRIASAQEAEVAVSQDHTTALQPGQ